MSLQMVSALRPAYSAEEYAVRTDLAAAYRLMAYFGLDDSIYTHISARVPGAKDQFLINPYGVLFRDITASSLIDILPALVLTDAADAGRTGIPTA